MKPHLKVHTCLLVFLLLWIVGVAIGVKPPVTCCTKTSDIKIEFNRICRYVLQERPLCPIKAVRFYTQKNRTICSDPTSDWAKRAMREVNRRTTTRVPQDVENRSTTLPLPITLSESPVTWISPGLKTKDTEDIKAKTTSGLSTIDKTTTSNKYPSKTTTKAPTSKPRRTLRLTPWTSTQDTSLMTSVVTQSSDITYVIHALLTTKEPPTTTKELWPNGLITGATERESTVGTGLRKSGGSLTPRMKHEVQSTAVTSHPTAPTEQTTGVTSHPTASTKQTTVQEPSSNSGPTPRKTFVMTTKWPLLFTTTTPHKPREMSTVTVGPSQISKVTRLPWIHRRLKKKSKIGLRRAQRKPR